MPCPAAQVYKRLPYILYAVGPPSLLVYTDMDASSYSNASLYSNATGVETEKALQVVNNGVRESPIVYTFVAVALAIVLLSGFEDGRKALQRIFWFLDGMLGGAPHTVTLPGPPGLPLVGNLKQVSFT